MTSIDIVLSILLHSVEGMQREPNDLSPWMTGLLRSSQSGKLDTSSRLGYFGTLAKLIGGRDYNFSPRLARIRDDIVLIIR